CPSKTPLKRQRCNSFSVAETSDPKQPHHIYFSLQDRSNTILNTIRRALQFFMKYLTKHMSTMVTFQCRSREYHASFGMGRLGSEGRRPLPTSPPLCRRHRAYNTEHRAGGTNAGRV
ncbi:hypothetical protein V3C99_011997, partial [Haemonchus contortus]